MLAYLRGQFYHSMQPLALGAEMVHMNCRRLSKEEAAASKHALENVKPDWATIQRIMEEFISDNAVASPAQGETWLCSYRLLCLGRRLYAERLVTLRQPHM